MQSKISVNIVSFNSRTYLKPCLEAVLGQSYPNIEIILIDNASQDDSIVFVKRNYPQIKIIQNKKNLGYAAAHNQGIRESKSDYILCLNPDVILDKDYIKNALSLFKINSKIGAVTGKLLKLSSDNNQQLTSKKPNIIDSTGLKIFKNHQVVDRGQGEEDKGQYDKLEQVFGVSGAAPIFLRKAIEKIKIPKQPNKKFVQPSFESFEYFDESFFSYKEDIDLSWRLNLLGWQCWYLPRALAWHVRSVWRSNDFFTINRALRKKRPKEINWYSYKNHWLLLFKNESARNLLRYFPYIFGYELKKLVFLLIFEPQTLTCFPRVIGQLPLTFQKRKFIMSKRKSPNSELKKWFQ